MVSPAMQRYAAEIYRLQESYFYVPLSILADHADVSLQATSRMIRRLKDANLIEHEPYAGVRLTSEGEKAALPAIRRHRLIESFLVNVMQFRWEEIHNLADVLEQGTDQVLEDRMDELTGYPTQCPHGEPIPSKDCVMPDLNDASLVSLRPGTSGIISRVRIHDPEILHYLAELKCVPGAEIQLLSLAPFNGPVRILIEDQEHILGHDLGTGLWINAFPA